MAFLHQSDEINFTVVEDFSKVTKMYKICYSEAFTWYKLRKMICQYFSEEAKKGMKVLEVGCGAGTNIWMFNDLFYDAKGIEFYGMDISLKAIKAAKEYEVEMESKNCFFTVGDAERLGYKDDSFDIVVCTEVLEHLPNPNETLKEIHRVLKLGGVAIITTPNRENILKKIAGKMIEEKVEADCQKTESYQKVDDSFGHISVLSSKEIIELSKEVGFKIEKIRKGSLVYGLPYFDRHQILFGVILIFDAILDHLPHNYNFSWHVVLKLRKI
ncbi:MAG: putative methyltransferase YcgJ [candidate division WS2 bacterium]|nr:MAG: class I SAM-dependent methyltransferase [Methanosarcinales archaeon Met12]MBT9150143.1 putative methyltransferase YcgJ [Candidatus Psychracetigena formicireducens]